ncbi:hypothetical protein [Streptomyces sp. NPDC005760]|uniref:hypothetical protein n=1 Tax=Streptomyces sp. NPDC005760 TaxID=3156718 RepID=UPI0033DACA04
MTSKQRWTAAPARRRRDQAGQPEWQVGVNPVVVAATTGETAPGTPAESTAATV